MTPTEGRCVYEVDSGDVFTCGLSRQLSPQHAHATGLGRILSQTPRCSHCHGTSHGMAKMAVAPMTRGGEGYKVCSDTDIMTMMTVMSVLVLIMMIFPSSITDRQINKCIYHCKRRRRQRSQRELGRLYL